MNDRRRWSKVAVVFMVFSVGFILGGIYYNISSYGNAAFDSLANLKNNIPPEKSHGDKTANTTTTATTTPTVVVTTTPPTATSTPPTAIATTTTGTTSGTATTTPPIITTSTSIAANTGTNTTTLPIVATTAAATTTLNYNFGIATGDTLPWMSAAQSDAELSDIASLGIGWIRLDMGWDDVQPDNSSTYNWTNLDRIVAEANALHIKILPTLAYTPAWARSGACPGTPKCMPSDPSQFATFAKAAAQRYAPSGIHIWEIWNEPNITVFWQPAPSAAAYASLLKAADIAIKSQDASATVIMAGLSPANTIYGNIAPVEFLSQLYTDGAQPYFDAVAYHPYTFPAMPLFYAGWNPWSQMAATTPSLRSVMSANGDANKKIWLTEYGAPTGGPGNLETSATDTVFGGSPDHVTEALQAQMLAQAVTAVESDPWAGPFFVYSYKDLGTSNTTVENFFGLIRNDGSTKPAYATLKTLVAL